MTSKNRIQVYVSMVAAQQLANLAAAKGLGVEQVAKQLLEAELNKLSVPLGAQAHAEHKLLAWVRHEVAQYRAAGTWDEHITLTIFDRIHSEMSVLHTAATQGGHATRIHRAIGRIVKQTLHAVTRYDGGRLNKVDLPHSAGHLIRSYTLLYQHSDVAELSVQTS